MRLYAIHDRLVGYFQQPFVANSDHQVKASLAQLVTTGDKTNAIAATPHHFELWSLAEIDEETGNVKPNPEFLCDCSSLIRDRVRQTDDAGVPTLEGPGGQNPRAPGGDQVRTRANGRAPGAPPQRPHTASREAPSGNPGGTD